MYRNSIFFTYADISVIQNCYNSRLAHYRCLIGKNLKYLSGSTADLCANATFIHLIWGTAVKVGIFVIFDIYYKQDLKKTFLLLLKKTAGPTPRNISLFTLDFSFFAPSFFPLVKAWRPIKIFRQWTFLLC